MVGFKVLTLYDSVIGRSCNEQLCPFIAGFWLARNEGRDPYSSPLYNPLLIVVSIFFFIPSLPAN